MAWTEEDKQTMDKAADVAREELEEIQHQYGSDPTLPFGSVQLVAGWWAKWYPKAGHKRLARILLQYKSKEG